MEVWDDDSTCDYSEDDKIDNFTFPLSSPLLKFNLSNSLTVQGNHKLGQLTLSYGYLTTNPTHCSSMESPLSSISTQTHQGIYSTTTKWIILWENIKYQVWIDLIGLMPNSVLHYVGSTYTHSFQSISTVTINSCPVAMVPFSSCPAVKVSIKFVIK